MLRIELINNKTVFRPGDSIGGTASWDMVSMPATVTAYLTWRTEGKGDEDSDIAMEQKWVPADAKGDTRFSWVAPRAPISLDGRLIRIVWEVVLTSEKPDDEFVLPIVISHLQTPIVLPELIKSRVV